jgi:hypothetical protein
MNLRNFLFSLALIVSLQVVHADTFIPSTIQPAFISLP